MYKLKMTHTTRFPVPPLCSTSAPCKFRYQSWLYIIHCATTQVFCYQF